MTSDKMLIRKNDRIVFFGDSITEQMLYTNYVESYLATRFPGLNLTFFNAGWGGDTACGALARVDRDVLALKPTLVTLCFGMNDGRYTQPSEEIRGDFVRGMTGLLARFRKARVRVVLLTPGYVDEQANRSLAGVQYNTRGVRILADETLKLARRERLPAFDLHRLMNEVDRKGKAANPRFCMAPDGVHPTPAGHLVMAYGLLKALRVPPLKELVVLDAARLRTRSSAGVTVRAVRGLETGMEADLQLDRIPFYVEPAARSVLPFLPFQTTYNQLTVKVRGLAHPWLSLSSDGRLSSAFKRDTVEQGINLCSLWTSRPVQLAERVHRFTCEKDLMYYKAWRLLGLESQQSPAFYNKAAHHELIRASPKLDAARLRLLDAESRRFTLKITSADIPGETIGSGDRITCWRIQGPFPAPFRTDALGGEAAFSRDPVLNEEWVRVQTLASQNEVNLLQTFGPAQNCFAYAVAILNSSKEQEATLTMGSDDGLAAWLNGTLLSDKQETLRPLKPDEDIVPCRLRKGRNVLLLKITQATGGWAFAVRLDGLRTPVTAVRT